MSEEKRDPGFIDRSYEATVQSNTSGPKEMPRRRASFVVDHEICVPGTFDTDFELTIQSLTSRQELDAARASGGEPLAMGYALAQSSLHAVNGTQLNTVKREWLWEHLGQAGRNLVAGMYAETVGAGEIAMGKARNSLKIHT